MAPETHTEAAIRKPEAALLPERDDAALDTTVEEQPRSGGKFDALLALAGAGKGIWNEDAVEYQRRLRGSV